MIGMRGASVAIRVLMCACVLGLPVAAAAQDAAKGAALLADARKAIGGEDKLAAVKRLQVSGNSKRAAGNQTLEGDITVYIEAPDKYRVTEEIGLPGGAINVTRTQVLNGTEVWDENEGGNIPGGGFRGGGGGRGGFGGGGGSGNDGGGFRDGGGGRGRRGDLAGVLGGATGDAQGPQGQGGRGQIDPERLKEAQRRTRQADLARYLLVLLLSTNDAVTWVGTAQSPDGTADVLEIKPAEGAATRLFLDSTTHMPLMVTWDAAAARGFGGRGGRGRGGDAQGAAPATPPANAQAPAFEMHLSDYKAVNGIKFPQLITRGLNGQTQEEIQVKNVKINPSFKSNTFTQSK